MAFGLEISFSGKAEKEQVFIDDVCHIVSKYGEIQRDPNFELGPWGLPITSFIYRFVELKRNSPQYTDEEAAAVVYFGMVAQQPEPTADYSDIAIDWATVDSILYSDKLSDYFILSEGIDRNTIAVLFEEDVRLKILRKRDGQPYFGMRKNDAGKWQIYFGWQNVRLTRSIKESYVASVYHLNNWLHLVGLYGGIEKTLAEESRKLQGLRAKALASQAAAARALALSKASGDVSDEAVERYQKQLEEAQAKEQELTDYLQKINNTPTGTNYGTLSGGALPLIIGAAAALFALR